MARGWESKSIESQIESAEAEKAPKQREHLTPEQVELLRRKESLLLSRTRVLRDLQSARNPRYQKLLKNELAHLDKQLNRMS